MHKLDCLEEGLPVGDLVGDSGEDLLERQRLLVQLLEGLLGAAGLVLCIVLLGDGALQPQEALVSIFFLLLIVGL